VLTGFPPFAKSWLATGKVFSMALESWFAQGMATLAARWSSTTSTELFWLGIGFAAQTMFMMRFIIQWLASEKARRSVVPEMFWYWSLAGGFMLFVYAIYRLDPVFMLGQGSGLFIYARNIYFIRRSRVESQTVMREGLTAAE
jgi:lipid-A-disaccharide synthase-like uncharacterized protein